MTATSRRLARLLLAIGENRLELLMAALRDERRHVVQALLLPVFLSGCEAGERQTTSLSIRADKMAEVAVG